MNENIINKFIELIAGWSPAAQIFGFIILLSSLGFFFFEKVRTAIIALIYHLLRISNDNPSKHPFFLQKVLLDLQIDRIDFDDKHKNWLFKTLLKIKFKISFDLIYEFVKNNAWKNLKRHELQATLLLLVKNIIDRYEIEIKQAYTIKFGNQGNRLFQIVYYSEKGFKKYHRRNVENIQQNISKMFLVESFNNNEIVNSFILQIWVALDTAMNDCVAAFRNLNGDLKSEIDKYTENV